MGGCDGGGQRPQKKRKSRAKGNSKAKAGEVLIAAHNSRWSMIGQVKPKGSRSYISNWSCTVCGATQTNSSIASNAMPNNVQHSAVIKK